MLLHGIPTDFRDGVRVLIYYTDIRHGVSPEFIGSCNCVPLAFTAESPPVTGAAFAGHHGPETYIAVQVILAEDLDTLLKYYNSSLVGLLTPSISTALEPQSTVSLEYDMALRTRVFYCTCSFQGYAWCRRHHVGWYSIRKPAAGGIFFELYHHKDGMGITFFDDGNAMGWET